jgi:hypothetical protein
MWVKAASVSRRHIVAMRIASAIRALRSSEPHVLGLRSREPYVLGLRSSEPHVRELRSRVA